VSVAPDPSLDKMAALVTADGVTVRAPASRPMDDARLETKFRSLAGQRAEPLLKVLRSLETLEVFSAP